MVTTAEKLTDKIQATLELIRQIERDMDREPPLCGPCLDEGLLTPAIEPSQGCCTDDVLLCERHFMLTWR